ncbi:tryptophan halogenase family protein [Planctobacterium marinum]|uniref:tryptophan halogenase family protein n=1 Tax=Planctobacterium marinum TaxID=1631968 RepID=UPI002B4BF5F2|nr:tryptophan halogenase family protein [Planctobacterium marinum]MCC2606708.1 tryptophan 7-halogenase [Planctobacterium marinum]
MNSISDVVIAGGGTAGWMAAASLSKLLGKSLNITLVESDEIGTVGVGEATIPPIRTLHKLLDIDERAFMKATQATFKLGIQFENWGQQGDSYIHSFGITGRECWAGEFHHFWLRAQQEGMTTPFGAFCLEHEAALENKFALHQQVPLNFAYHLDATRYGQFLREMAQRQGVTRTEGKIAKVMQCPDSGYISALQLQNGDTVRGDLFIDCTGFRGLLIEQTLHTGYDNWSHYLPCDSALAVQCSNPDAPKPYTRSIAHQAGWQWQIPLQTRVGNGLVYSSQYQDDSDAQTLLMQNIPGEPLTDPRVIRFTPGKRRKGWHKNCVALGLASGFIEPLESTSIHLIMTGLVRLMRLFPFNGITDAAINEYNNKFDSEMQCILDFIVMHYAATERRDSEFWRHCASMELPPSLQHKIALFKETGRVFLDDGDIFRVDSWTQVMLGQRLKPQQYHPIVNEMSQPEFQRFMHGLQMQVKQQCNALPEHGAFIKQYLG